jgi:putative DNA primase/helicase
MTWTYRDRQGAVLCHVWRFNLKGKDGKPVLDEHGKQEKAFAPLTFCLNAATGQTTWRWRGLPEPKPLYNLDKLTANPQATVLICEGEKAADASSELFPECVITTTLNGAQSPHKTDFSPLQGRIVWICPDYDEPGRKYAKHVIELLKGIAREVKCLHIPGDHPKGWDVRDTLIED